MKKHLKVYGDISPLTMKARCATIAEGVTGQFHLAVLVRAPGGHADELIDESADRYPTAATLR